MVTGMNIVRPKFHSFLQETNELMIKHNKNQNNTNDISNSSSTTSRNKTNINTITNNHSNRNNMSNIPTTTHRTIIVHCWRGGMRSHALAYLLANRGDYDQVIVLSGGYKAFRNWSRLVYCYLPINAPFNFVTTSQNTDKIDNDSDRNKTRSVKKNLK
mmetsp:Transcript_27996/g.23491  ORF Transcript_27996/g.23491 Transcript_27996/m.23491 type:complete len:158 (-) Transcript_27996:756-1229(-)